ncbi:MAG TPA: alpha-L-fucosidase, partial [Polyangia bacterium]|nr:alpha-L-fucosidase [Polyangia bacterium]
MNVQIGLARAQRASFVLALASLAAGAGCGSSSPSGMTSGSGGAQSTGGAPGTATGGSNGSTGGRPGSGGGDASTGGSPASGGGPGSGGVIATGGSTGRAGNPGATGGAAGGRSGPGTGGAAGGPGTGGAPAMCAKSMATFSDITANHAVPTWLKDASFKYAIGMHFGPYSVGAHHNEWDSRHMYCDSSIRQWYIDHFGSNGKVGYKDLIAKMTLANFDPASWAALFKKAKASMVFGSAQHHDRFAMWNSPHTKWCIYKTAGRDVIGELAAAVRAQGMKFGVLDHALYGYSFQWCGSSADKTVDLYDPQYADLYGDYAGWDPTKASPYASSGPPNGGCDISSNGGICQSGQPNQGFMNEWLTRAKELTDQYQPDIHWFDWDGIGANHATKLAFASYYYNAA